MLVLVRKSGTSFTIGDDITVTFLGSYGKNGELGRIGIDAPQEYIILRDELKKRLEEENEQIK